MAPVVSEDQVGSIVGPLKRNVGLCRQVHVGNGRLEAVKFEIQTIIPNLFNIETDWKQMVSRIGSACHRTSAFAYKTVYLSGPTYDGTKMWNIHWINELPIEAFLHSGLPMPVDDRKDARGQMWTVTYHCLSRTKFYHELLHYKFHLFLRVRQHLQCNENVTDEFVADELERYSRLV